MKKLLLVFITLLLIAASCRKESIPKVEVHIYLVENSGMQFFGANGEYYDFRSQYGRIQVCEMTNQAYTICFGVDNPDPILDYRLAGNGLAREPHLPTTGIPRNCDGCIKQLTSGTADYSILVCLRTK